MGIYSEENMDFTGDGSLACYVWAVSLWQKGDSFVYVPEAAVCVF